MFESIDVQRQAVNTAHQMMRNAARAQDVTIIRTHDPTTDRINLYAFIGTIYRTAELSERLNNKRITIEIKSQGIESYLFINENTIGMLNDLIQHVYFGEPLRELTDSSTAALFSLVAWDSMSIRFTNLLAHFGDTSTNQILIYQSTEFSRRLNHQTTNIHVLFTHCNSLNSSHLKR